MIKNLKKLFILIALCFVFWFSILNSNLVHASTMKYFDYDFSNISEEECLEFIDFHSIDVPEKIVNSPILGNITKDIIQLVVDNPNYKFFYNYDEMQIFAETIQELVCEYSNEHYGISVTSTSTYTLQDSKVKNSKGNWVTSGGAYDDRWEYYNCYAYSIHRMEQPPFYGTSGHYQPGDMSGSGSFGTSKTIFDFATVVKNDLLAMGYFNVSLSKTFSSITSDQELICVRMGIDDYHFMRYDFLTNAWYHKPGNSAVLKYNYVPSNDRIWNNEGSIYGVEVSPFYSYDSDIYFIKYDKNKVEISSKTSNLSYNVKINAAKDSILEIDNSTYNKYYRFNISSSNSFKVELYDHEMELKDTFTGTNIEVYIGLTTNPYYVKLNYENSTILGIVTITISAHNHEYTYEAISNLQHLTSCYCGYATTSSHVNDKHACKYCGIYISAHDYDMNYKWVSTTKHSAQCICGAKTQEGHAVRSGSNTCLLCGGRADIGIVEIQSLLDKTYVTENGSYILPNEIIVLMDEDIEAFLNGTLLFYKNNCGYEIQ